MGLYRALMEEIKLRLNAIEDATSGRLGMAPRFVTEFSYLQLRMICESVALGCLVIHGDIEKARSTKMQKKWHVDEIFAALEELHPAFYPIPHVRQSIAPGHHHFVPAEGEFLTKQDLRWLWSHAGSILHRGNVKKLLRASAQVQKAFPDIEGWSEKIVRLLDQHRIALFDARSFIMCTMETPVGSVQVVYAEAMNQSEDGPIAAGSPTS